MKKLKPNYNPEAVQGELVEAVCTAFGRVFDDDEQERHNLLRGHRPGDEKWLEIMGDDLTLREVAEEFGINTQKVKKLLVTGGYFDTETYREITRLRGAGKSLEEIAAEMKLKPASVRTYLPYERVIYKLQEPKLRSGKSTCTEF